MGLVSIENADPETAWLAGIIEGEGSIYGGYYARWRGSYFARVKVDMTDDDIVREVARVAGYGTVRGPFKKKNSSLGTVCKDQTRWCVQNKAGFLATTQRLYPYLGTRRRAKIEEIYREAPWILEPYFFEEETDGHRATPTDLQANLPMVLGSVRDRGPSTEILPSVPGEAPLMDL